MTTRQQQEYINLLGKLSIVENYLKDGDIEKSLVGIEMIKERVEMITDQYVVIEVAEELTGNESKFYSSKHSFKEIASKAKELGINYIAIRKDELTRQVNEHIAKTLDQKVLDMLWGGLE